MTTTARQDNRRARRADRAQRPPTMLLAEQRRPSFRFDPLRDAEAALSSLEWVTAAHPVRRTGPSPVAVALGRISLAATLVILAISAIAAR